MVIACPVAAAAWICYDAVLTFGTEVSLTQPELGNVLIILEVELIWKCGPIQNTPTS